MMKTCFERLFSFYRNRLQWGLTHCDDDKDMLSAGYLNKIREKMMKEIEMEIMKEYNWLPTNWLHTDQ